MAISYTYYDELNLVVMKGSGRITAQDFKDFILGLMSGKPSIKPGFIELADMRFVEKNEITQQEMLDIVHLEETCERPQPAKLAFVTASDAEFGAARQYAAHVHLESKAVEVFRSMHEAKQWLGIDDFEIE